MGVAGKFKNYKGVTKELEAAGIEYRPFVYTALGAPHPIAIQSLAAAAQKATACPRAGPPGVTLARWKLRIAVTIWRRAARMAHRCLTPLADPEHDTEHCRDQSEQEAAVVEDIYPDDLDFGANAD